MRNDRYGGKWLLLACLLAGFVVPCFTWVSSAEAQNPVSLTLYDPTGAFEVTQTFANRVSDLNGKTVCELTDDMWEADRILQTVQELMQKQFPTVKVMSYDKLPTLSLGIDVPGLENAVKNIGCEAVVVASAG